MGGLLSWRPDTTKGLRGKSICRADHLATLQAFPPMCCSPSALPVIFRGTSGAHGTVHVTGRLPSHRR